MENMNRSTKQSETIQRIEANVPQSLKDTPQWVLWKWERRGDEIKKPPFSINGERASVTNPSTWTSYENARDSLLSHSQDYNGIGYILTSGIVVIDLDHCLSIVYGERRITKIARQIFDTAHSYSEISPSGNGLHIFLKGSISRAGRRTKGIEMYQSQRYITITGDKAGEEGEIREDQEAINTIYKLIPSATETERAEETIKPPPTLKPTDTQVIEKASTARNGAKFESLYNGNISAYPSKSEADLALIAMLAYWTNGDPMQIDRLFRQSALFTPQTARKWDEKHAQGFTYGQITIMKAIRTTHPY